MVNVSRGAARVQGTRKLIWKRREDLAAAEGDETRPEEIWLAGMLGTYMLSLPGSRMADGSRSAVSTDPG